MTDGGTDPHDAFQTLPKIDDIERTHLDGPSTGFKAHHPHSRRGGCGSSSQVGQGRARVFGPGPHVKDHFPISHVEEL